MLLGGRAGRGGRRVVLAAVCNSHVSAMMSSIHCLGSTVITSLFASCFEGVFGLICRARRAKLFKIALDFVGLFAA